MATKRAVEDFLRQKRWAFVGVSENKRKFGSYAYQELKAKGLDVIPVNPKLQRLGEDAVYPSLKALPNQVDAIVVAVSRSKVDKIVQEASEQGIRHIWLQQGSESPEVINYCKEKGINCISGECILMFVKPFNFPHSFHRFIWRVIGKLPK